MCPKCGSLMSKVIDTRYSTQVKLIRRRRECLDCGHRFTTHEVPVGYIPSQEMAKTMAPELYDVIVKLVERKEDAKEFEELSQSYQAMYFSWAKRLIASLIREYPVIGKIAEEVS